MTFFDGTSKILKSQSTAITVGENYRVTITGEPYTPDLEVTKIFKFYYTDADGNPDLSLASSRLIVETYGGTLSATQHDDVIAIELVLPLVLD